MSGWWLSYDERMVVEFVLKSSVGTMWGNPFPDCLQGLTYRREVELFIDKLAANKTCCVPKGLDFYGKVTWKRLITEHREKQMARA